MDTSKTTPKPMEDLALSMRWLAMWHTDNPHTGPMDPKPKAPADLHNASSVILQHDELIELVREMSARVYGHDLECIRHTSMEETRCDCEGLALKERARKVLEETDGT